MTDYTAPCPAEFETTLQAVYSTFTIMLNMISIGDYDVQDKVALHFLHCFFIVVVAITTLNFLIAILSNDVSVLMEHIDIAVKVQQLTAVIMVEGRMSYPCHCLYSILRKLSFHHSDGYTIIRVNDILPESG
jgi:hypothetical protein